MTEKTWCPKFGVISWSDPLLFGTSLGCSNIKLKAGQAFARVQLGVQLRIRLLPFGLLTKTNSGTTATGFLHFVVDTF